MVLMDMTSGTSEAELNKWMSLIVTLKERETFITWSPILDETGSGDTEAEALKELKEAIKLRLMDKNMPIPKDAKLISVTYSSMRVEPVSAHDEIISKALKIGA